MKILSAFPWITDDGERIQGEKGMTLRDYFAAKAMQSLIHVQVKTAQQMTAETAYEWADAMMSRREK